MIFKALASVVLTILIVSTACVARSVPMLVGAYTGGQSKGIAVYRFDEKSGQIGPVPVQVVAADNPSWLTMSANHRFVYAVHENGEGQRDPVGRVSAWRLNPLTGRMVLINRMSSLGSEPTHASLSRDGRALFVANYAAAADPGGTLAVLPVAANGALRAVTQIKTHRASLANPQRQSSPHVHSVVSSPDGRYVFAQDLGADRIYAYRYNSAHPETALAAVKDQPFVDMPAGSGPRHMVFSPSGRQAYVTLEMVGEVAVLDYAEGHLTVRQRVPLAPSGFHGSVGAAALHFSPDGRFLSVTDRGTDNCLVTFAVSPADGALRQVDRQSVEGLEPREFAFSPDGRFVLVANQRSHAIIVFRRDPATGVVGERVQTLPIDQASNITFVTPVRAR